MRLHFKIAFTTLIFLTASSQLSAIARDNEQNDSSPAAAEKSEQNKTEDKKSNFLYGRIEQLGDQSGGLPKLSLPDATAKLSEDDQQSAKQTRALSGKVIADYPATFPLHWGGHICLTKTTEKDESFVPGLSGNIRFDFQRSKKGLSLQPSQAVFWVPLRNSHCGSVAAALLSQGRPAYLYVSTKVGLMWSGKACRLSTEDLDKPIIAVFMNLGLHGETRNALESGERWKIQMVQDSLRQLDPQTFEQDAIARMVQSRTRVQEYEEQVIRLRLDDEQKSMSIRVADLHFDAAGTFMSEKDYEGTIIAGEEVDTRGRTYAVLSSPDPNAHYLFN